MLSRGRSVTKRHVARIGVERKLQKGHGERTEQV